MSDLADKLSEELDELRALRDEIQVQMHLGQAETRERFEKLEKSWQHLEGKLKLLRQESKEELADIGKAARQLVTEIRDGYRHIKSLI